MYAMHPKKYNYHIIEPYVDYLVWSRRELPSCCLAPKQHRYHCRPNVCG